MNKSELQQELMRFNDADNLKTKIEQLDIFINCYFDLVINHHKDEVYLKEYADAKMVLQMMFLKLLHLRKSLEGVNLNRNNKKALSKDLIDPTIIASQIRNIYETTCLFNLIYIHPNFEEERKIHYTLWIISGLKYRQKFSKYATSDKNKRKVKEEEKAIEELIDFIKNSKAYKNLDEKNQRKMDNVIKRKDFKIKIENKKIRILSWQDISNEMISEYSLLEEMYNYFSSYTHPSYTSVFQFGEMFKLEDKAFMRLTVANLRFLFTFASIFLADYIRVFPKTMETYNSRTDIEQIILNFYNMMLRGESFSINETWKKLG